MQHVRESSPWPRRLALTTAACAVPLVLFGGSVTTMGAGLAVEGWLNAEGHFLPFFPVEKWFRDADTFVEHSHRLFGMLVGFAALATVAATFRTRSSRAARAASLVALFAVSAQGALGGLRVLERSPELAFLHGAFGQAVFALLCATAVLLTPPTPGSRSVAPSAPSRALARGATLFAAAVLAQVVLGAWYRHGLRPEPVASAGLRFALHGTFAAVVFVVGLVLGERLRAASDARSARDGVRLSILLVTQVLLGLAAWAAFRPGDPTLAAGAISVLHVVCGALLLAQAAVAALRTSRANAVAEAGGALVGAEVAR